MFTEWINIERNVAHFDCSRSKSKWSEVLATSSIHGVNEYREVLEPCVWPRSIYLWRGVRASSTTFTELKRREFGCKVYGEDLYGEAFEPFRAITYVHMAWFSF